MKHLVALALLMGAGLASAQQGSNPATADPWWALGRAEVAARSKAPAANRRARNVILFVGDGMGPSTVTAARIFEAQQKAKAAGGKLAGFGGGEENRLSFEAFPATAMVKTYNSNAQVPDSAGTASAMTTGIKTRIGVLGLRASQDQADCDRPAGFPRTIGELARARGMAVGVVTTTRLTHATPAAVWAHSPNRNFEGADRAYPPDLRKGGCPDIAAQLVAFPGGIDVALGGGRRHFLPTSAAGGARDDGRDLMAEWRAANPGAQTVTDAAGFRALSPTDRAPVLGLFNDDHISFRFDRDRAAEPSLPELAGFAVRKLRASGRGYFLMVEAGRIDHAHHLTNAMRALDETVELSDTVTEVLRHADLRDTLILVTADHSHVFTIAGYPPRGNDILGLIRPIEGGESRTGVDAAGNSLDARGRTMTTLGYANGPLEVRVGNRVLNAQRPSTDPDFLVDKLHILDIETHGGEDVALYATGPGSALVAGVLEQNSIFHIMAHALGWR
jgi:alkaline phosphatase